MLSSLRRKVQLVPLLHIKIKRMSTKPEDLVKIVEGSASMNYDKNEAVFYNKVQVFNRDLSIQVIRLFAQIRENERRERYEAKMSKFRQNPSTFEREPFAPIDGITVLDALAATGLRSVRYLKEIPGVRHVTINDLDEKAVKQALDNCHQNNVDDSRVSIHHGDAILYMHQKKVDPLEHFDVIDLDPYGTASPFLDSAVQCVADGGLLCVTCTDMPTLAGNYPEVCFAKYGCIPLKAKYVHEMSLRILLHAIDAAANKHKRYIVPWLSLSVDFYVRVFVRVYESPAEVKKSAQRRTMVYQSSQCPSFYLQPIAGDKSVPPSVKVPSQCPETNGNFRLGGPYWSDPIHKQSVIDELLRRVKHGEVGSADLPFPVSTKSRMVGILTSIAEELKDVMFYYTIPSLSATLKCITPTGAALRSALTNAGYRSSQFHRDPHAVKTDAPPQVVRLQISSAFLPCYLYPYIPVTLCRQHCILPHLL